MADCRSRAWFIAAGSVDQDHVKALAAAPDGSLEFGGRDGCQLWRRRFTRLIPGLGGLLRVHVQDKDPDAEFVGGHRTGQDESGLTAAAFLGDKGDYTHTSVIVTQCNCINQYADNLIRV